MKKGLIAIICLTILGCCSCDTKPRVIAKYEGKDISGIAQIQRDKKSKAATLEINTTGKWTLYAGETIEEINFFKPVLEGKGSGSFHIEVPGTARSYFELETKEGKAILAERLLPMEGAYNLRDLGGLKTKDGRFVKWGKIFRADDLDNLTDADLKYLSSIPITSIVDFRSKEEVEQAPDKIPFNTKRHYIYSIDPGNLSSMEDFSRMTSAEVDSFMKQINILFITDKVYVNRYKDFFRLLQDEGNTPLLFHCSAGKDRTGMGAALVLFALGVDENTIIKDYLSSNDYLSGKYAEYISQYPQMKSLFQVKAEFLQAGIDRIKKDHGSVQNFLEKELEVDIQKFRELYLYNF